MPYSAFSSPYFYTQGGLYPRGPDASTTSLSKAGTRTESRALGKGHRRYDATLTRAPSAPPPTLPQGFHRQGLC